MFTYGLRAATYAPFSALSHLNLLLLPLCPVFDLLYSGNICPNRTQSLVEDPSCGRSFTPTVLNSVKGRAGYDALYKDGDFNMIASLPSSVYADTFLVNGKQ